MKVSKSTLYFVGILILIAIASYIVFAKPSYSTDNFQGSQPVQGEVQKVVLGVKDFNYYPNTVRVKANQPVEISLDSSVTGCYRSFTIRDFGISKNLPTPQDKITFTPTKKGTYKFSCSMGMGFGNLIIE